MDAPADFRDAEQQFRAAAHAASVELPDILKTDGRLYRCGGDQACAYIYHPDDPPAGGFQNWRSGEGWINWCAKPERQLSPADRKRLEIRREADRKAREREELKLRREAAQRASEIWSKAQPAPADHAYLVAKQIGPHIARIHDDGRLVLALHDADNAVHSLLFIAADGEKRFLYGARKEGCFSIIGEIEPAGVLLIGEGFATMASCHAATGKPAIVAYDCGNLKSVAEALRAKYPDADIVLCADADAWTKDNPGQGKAAEAAQLVGARVAIPVFAGERLIGQTDFNDLHQAEGLDAVRRCTEAAIQAEIDAEAEIEALARGKVINFEKARKDSAARLGITLTGLDRVVKARRAELQRSARAGGSRARNGAVEDRPRYFDVDGSTYCWRTSRDGDEYEERLANFTARITLQCVHDDGVETERVYHVEAEHRGRARTLTIPAIQFNNMAWVATHLPATAYVEPGQVIGQRMAVAVRVISGDIPERNIYAHTGWARIGEQWGYVHAGGAIGADGAIPDVEVALRGKIADYLLPAPPTGKDLANAVRASLELRKLAELQITAPNLAVAYRAPFGGVDLSVWNEGRSGSQKSELAARVIQHWGSAWHKLHLPGTWSSTANSLEMEAFTVKDAGFVIDDFVYPNKSPGDMASLNKAADRVCRAQGNASGRGRLGPDARQRPAKPPRGMILSTGEDVPSGLSLRARLFLVPMKPGDIDLEELTKAQALGKTGLYAAAMAGYLQWIAARYDELKDELAAEVLEFRDKARDLADHGRTAENVANLAAGWSQFLAFAVHCGALDAEAAAVLKAEVWKALCEGGRLQGDYLASADPVEHFITMLASAISMGRAHVAATTGLAPIKDGPALWGWRKDNEDALNPDASDPWCSPAGGVRIGWVDGANVLLNWDAAFAVVQALASAKGEGGLGMTSETMLRRLHEAKKITAETPPGGKTQLKPKRTVEGKRVRVVIMEAIALFQVEKCEEGLSAQVGQVGHQEIGEPIQGLDG